ncbi:MULTISPECIES: aromatic ring-hydroxylating dioxygenase subunit alpha [Halomonadaceae]|jgi:anthranilate 1,2-dioxygenase large subunit|uniref:Rieske 2Fe-2S domain-containing protein n=1 Tax=Vreelandella piezotolerans TaxID=2609667 RepID=A0ABQ6X4E9_9GAMM|nr:MULTISPECIES: aromatic ring-hydroxylating dioxygenase subunit alpha [Halomonas]KAE8436908.1 Rieske 2Fe-2S domain-containing protein [Halomonas piezotolerans]MCE8014317.1 Rieske 2Fe-2S domain-containing protein [Halomonas desiderata]
MDGSQIFPGERPTWASEDGGSRVPYWVFQREDVRALENDKLFHGPIWNYLCLEAELAQPGDFVAVHAGETPVIVTRDTDDQLYAFENRCAHRGSLLALEDRGNVKDFTCVYHAWTHSLQGDLIGVAFKDGIKGCGGIAEGFDMAQYGPRKLRVASVSGMVFGTFDEDADDIEDYLGEEILGRIERVFNGRKPVVLGRFTQILPNNWKLYVENTKDSYHASILHTFFTTFELNRLSQKGGIIVSEEGGHHVSYSMTDREAEKAKETASVYSDQNIRSDKDMTLQDMSLLTGFKEFPDDITLQILTVFPNFVLQQIQNSIAIRRVQPDGIDRTKLHWTYLGFEDDTPEQRKIRLKQANLIGPGGYVSMEDGCIGGFVQRGIATASGERAVLAMGGYDIASGNDRITEASIRGFWTEYRARTGL